MTVVSLNLSKEQQKQLLNAVRLNDPPSLLKELLKCRHNQTQQASSGGGGANSSSNNNNNHHSLKNKFNCYSSRSADLDEDDEESAAHGSGLNVDSNSHASSMLKNNSNSNGSNYAQNGKPIHIANLNDRMGKNVFKLVLFVLLYL